MLPIKDSPSTEVRTKWHYNGYFWNWDLEKQSNGSKRHSRQPTANRTVLWASAAVAHIKHCIFWAFSYPFCTISRMFHTYENYGSRRKTCLQVQTESESKPALKFRRPWQTAAVHSTEIHCIHHAVFAVGSTSRDQNEKWTPSAKAAKFREPSQSTSER